MGPDPMEVLVQVVRAVDPLSAPALSPARWIMPPPGPASAGIWPGRSRTGPSY